MLAALAVLALAPQSPTGLFLERGTVVTDGFTPETLLRVPNGPGSVTAAPLQDSTPGFDWDTMFPTSLFPSGSNNFEMGGFSGGASRIVATSDGRADCAGASADWGFMMFALETTGPDANQQFVDQAAGNGLTNDIWSYWLPGSAIPPSFTDELELARDGVVMTNVDRITGMDHNLYTLGLAPRVSGPARDTMDTFFFTVHEDSLNDVPAWWFDDASEAGTLFATPSAATILKIEVYGGGWSAPMVHLNYDDMGLKVDDHITALAVDRVRHHVLCGLDRTGARLWVGVFDANWLPDDYTGPYLDENGDDFLTTVGIGQDVRFLGMCFGDPGDTDDPSLILDQTFGLPQGNTERPCFDVSISRSYERAVGIDFIDCYVSNLACLLPDQGTAYVYADSLLVGTIPINQTMHLLNLMPPVVKISLPVVAAMHDIEMVWQVRASGQTLDESSHKFLILP